ncbi:MAG: amidohydrolase family protein, partial [Phycisphaerae bacterium]
MRPNPANRLGLDYADQARHFARHPYPIIDAHAHIVGRQAAQVYQRAAQLYGIGLTYSMTPRPHIDAVRSVLGDSVRFIAVPDFSQFETLGSRLPNALGPDYARMIEELHSQGVRLVKFWSAPRRVDLEARAGVPDALRLTAPHILEAMSTAHRLGMVIMVHIGDPDTWFATKYADTQKYGSKRQQYEDLEEVLERFGTPFIAAHMGGWPENLPFLSDLLSRYPHLHLDTSATKWMVRELSKHPRPTLLAFFRRWTGRVLFGSDIVTSDSHLSADDEASPPPSSQAEAFDLYASRYWALRTLLETDTQTPSPIADPDLAMID